MVEEKDTNPIKANGMAAKVPEKKDPRQIQRWLG